MERHPRDLMWSHIGARHRWAGSHWEDDRQAVAEQWADEVAQSYRLEAESIEAIAQALDDGKLDPIVTAELDRQFGLQKATGKTKLNELVACKLRERVKRLHSFFRRLERPSGFAELLGRVAAYHTRALEDFDAKPRLLACPNGTLDIHTGLLRPAEREDLITKVTAVDYLEHARSEHWEKALVEWTEGDQSRARYLQAAYGYSLLGSPVLGRFCFMLHGPGQSGRSALLETLAAALGHYGSSFSWRAFDQMGASHDEDLAALRGLRFVFSNEAGDRQLDTEKLKAVTSGEEQRVSRKHERSFRMSPSFVVWAATNRLPELPSEDSALWTRIRVIPFRRVFALSSFRAKLAGDHDVLRAVLAWGVAGARSYLEHGLPKCAAVDAATAEAQRELNPLSAWLEERDEPDACAWTRFGQLFSDYQSWCSENAVAPLRRIGDRRFGSLLKSVGYEPKRRNGTRGNLGIRLRRGDSSAVKVS
jgi:putative DNA primase/helicase